MGFMDIFKATENKQLTEANQQLTEANQQLNESNKQLTETCDALRNRIIELENINAQQAQNYADLNASIPREKKDLDAAIEQTERLKQAIKVSEDEKEQLSAKISELESEYAELQERNNKEQASLDKATKNVQKLHSLFQRYKAAAKGYEKTGYLENIEVEESLLPVVEVNLNCMNVRELRTRYNQNQREIQKVFERYQVRYTSKSNTAIYKLMVIAMEAELQNVLSTLSYGKLEDALNHIKQITERYYQVAVEGNQSIASTMTHFIAEIDYLFKDTVEIEYEYHLQKQRIKEEQKALREQMRQEAEEQKALEAERKKIEKEESKYINEITQLNEKMADTTDQSQIDALLKRIEQLQSQVESVKQKKADIVNLQNGKAGYVYVISNLGSFGNDVFKIGMTRRLNPMDRVKELGDASVPFEFDVHSFIFSDDAPALENALHHELDSRRVNKVNLRKEFFRASVDEIESLVYEHFPTAEFNRTMLAEQYYQGLSITEPVQQIDADELSEEE